jgi:hypothetical protein
MRAPFVAFWVEIVGPLFYAISILFMEIAYGRNEDVQARHVVHKVKPRSSLDQDAYGAGVALEARSEQWRLAVAALLVHIRVHLDEQLHCRHATVPCSTHKQCVGQPCLHHCNFLSKRRVLVA